MSRIASLIVRIGAETENIDTALSKLGQQATTIDDRLKKIGSAPISEEAVKSASRRLVGVLRYALSVGDHELPIGLLTVRPTGAKMTPSDKGKPDEQHQVA